MLKELSDNDFIVSKTDTHGKITYVNQIFMDIADFKESELLGKPHNILRHKDMPKAVFKLLWERIKKKEEIFAYVINKTKNNDEYWVFANVTASLDERGNIIGYYSVRRKPSKKALEIIIPLYQKMIQVERTHGVDASMKILTDILKEKGISYDEFIATI